MVTSTVGEDEDELLWHRTDPLRVEIWPEEVLVDIGYSHLYEESRGLIVDQMNQHMWHYRYTEAGAWEPRHDGPPPYEPAGEPAPPLRVSAARVTC